LPKLVIEVRMIVRIHTALENLSIRRSVEKPGCDPQRAYSIAASPSFTDFAAFWHCCCPIQLRSDRSLWEQLQACEPPLINFIASLIASRRGLSEELTGYADSPSAFVVSRHTFWPER
jgi:hypothetical protein